MDNIGEIKYDIGKLGECLEHLEKAYKCLVDVDKYIIPDELKTKCSR